MKRHVSKVSKELCVAFSISPDYDHISHESHCSLHRGRFSLYFERQGEEYELIQAVSNSKYVF